jgi:hypothetical protein
MMNKTATRVDTPEIAPASKLVGGVVLAATLSIGCQAIFYIIVTDVLNASLLQPADYIDSLALVPVSPSRVLYRNALLSLGAGIVFISGVKFVTRPVTKFVILTAVVLFLLVSARLMPPFQPAELPAKISLTIMDVIGTLITAGVLISVGRPRTKRQSGS